MFPELPEINSEEIEHTLTNSKNPFTALEQPYLDYQVNGSYWQYHLS